MCYSLLFLCDLCGSIRIPPGELILLGSALFWLKKIVVVSGFTVLCLDFKLLHKFDESVARSLYIFPNFANITVCFQVEFFKILFFVFFPKFSQGIIIHLRCSSNKKEKYFLHAIIRIIRYMMTQT
jgi:hypothetical protein